MASRIPLVKEIQRVPSMTVSLDRQEDIRFQSLMEELIMIDLHEHPFVFPDDLNHFFTYLHEDQWQWGYEAVKHGGWTAVGTSNCLSCLVDAPEFSLISFDKLVREIGSMLADVSLRTDAVKVTNAKDIEAAKQRGKIGFLPTAEHLAIGNDIRGIDILHALGVRLAGLTYNRRNSIGDGIYEATDGGLSLFGVDVIHRMNELGMAVDLSHASFKTAMDAMQHSKAPCLFSHNGAAALRQIPRLRKDEELLNCAKSGGLVAICAPPNQLSDDPNQDIECVLNHYDYMVKLVGIDHVGIGTDTTIGDHVDFQRRMMGNDVRRSLNAPYLNGLESPADGKNIIRGLIARGYSDSDIRKIAGGNALAYLQRVMR